MNDKWWTLRIQFRELRVNILRIAYRTGEKFTLIRKSSAHSLMYFERRPQTHVGQTSSFIELRPFNIEPVHLFSAEFRACTTESPFSLRQLIFALEKQKITRAKNPIVRQIWKLEY